MSSPMEVMVRIARKYAGGFKSVRKAVEAAASVASEHVVEHIRRVIRYDIKQKANCREIVSNSDHARKVNDLLRSGSRPLLDSWFIGSKSLRECNRTDLEAAIDDTETQIGGLKANASFYRMLCSKITGSRTVGQCVKNSDAVMMLRKAGGGK